MESRLERLLKIKVDRMGGKALKFVSPNYAGVPDRIVLVPSGKAIFVEMKAPGKPLRPLQEKRMRELTNMGFKVYKIDSVEKIDKFIEEVFT